MFLEELRLIDQQVGQLDKEMATLLSQQQAAVERLAEVPGLGVDSAQQIIAEVGAKAATFASAKHLSSWVGACPGEDESAGVSKSHRSPKGNRHMRAFSISVPTPQPSRKEPFSRSSMANWCRAWDTIKPSGPLPIGFVA